MQGGERGTFLAGDPPNVQTNETSNQLNNYKRLSAGAELSNKLQDHELVPRHQASDGTQHSSNELRLSQIMTPLRAPLPLPFPTLASFSVASWTFVISSAKRATLS